MAALSQTFPERLIEQSTPLSAIRRWNCSLVYCLCSTDCRNTCVRCLQRHVECLVRCLPAKRLARPAVQSCCHRQEVVSLCACSGPSLSGSTVAAAHWYSRGFLAATGCVDRRSRYPARDRSSALRVGSSPSPGPRSANVGKAKARRTLCAQWRRAPLRHRAQRGLAVLLHAVSFHVPPSAAGEAAS